MLLVSPLMQRIRATDQWQFVHGRQKRFLRAGRAISQYVVRSRSSVVARRWISAWHCSAG